MRSGRSGRFVALPALSPARAMSTHATDPELRRDVAELDALAAQWPAADRDRLQRAVSFATEHHGEQRRRSGEPYVTHPLRVAAIVAELRADPDTVIAAVLHDTVEDTDATLADITERFGKDVAGLVDGATKVAAVRGDDPDQLEAARLRKLFVAVAADPRVVIIKLADRLHNMRTIEALPPVKQARIARETLAIHGPLAHRLGLAAIKTELEDRAFAVAHPEEYAETRRVLADIPQLAAALENARATLVDHLVAVGIHATVQARIKHAWSVFRKARAGYDVESLHDLLGLRIIVETVTECYAALGEVHALWEPFPNRIKDYIAQPKFNAYRSLHTTVHIAGRLLEVQIRTEEMHRQAEWGDAAHHAYKTHTSAAEPQWLQRLLDWHDASDDGEYLREISSELGADELWVLTPTGEVVTLPSGAGVIDFAYAIHTEVGHRCSGAKVNGKLVPLSSKLRSGDRVEIVTGRSTGPSLDWLAYTATGRAQNRVRQWHGRRRRAATRDNGLAALAALVARLHTTVERAGPVLVQTAGVSNWETLADHVGSGLVDIARLERALQSFLHGGAGVEAAPVVPPATKPGPRATPDHVVVAPGLEGVDIALAGCCAPVAPAAIIGVSSRTRGVVAHREGCVRALDTIAQSPGRQVRVRWVAPDVGVAAVHVVCENVPGALARVAVALAELGADIETSSSSIAPDGRGVQHYEITHRSSRAKLRSALQALDGVHSVTVS